MKKRLINKNEKTIKLKAEKENELRAAQRFIIILAIVSILGFTGIVSETLFSLNIEEYIEATWLMLLGMGLIVEIRLKKLKSISTQGLNRDNFSYIITTIIGVLAILAGIFSLPQIKIEHSSFLAIKGILSIIAITIILIETWFIKRK